jgi:uncharacterized lipoprotein YbaY
VSGRVVIVETVDAFAAGTLHVFLEDISYADRASTVLASTMIDDVSHPAPSGHGAESVIEFVVESTSPIDPKADYSVRASIDVPAADGRDACVIASDCTYPVLTRGHGAEVAIVLERARPAAGPH